MKNMKKKVLVLLVVGALLVGMTTVAFAGPDDGPRPEGAPIILVK